MASETPVRRARPSPLAIALNYLSHLTLFAVCGVMLFLAWPMIQARLASTPLDAISAPLMQPTALIQLRSAPAVQSVPQAAPIDVRAEIDAYNATATAQYQAALRVPNVDATGDTTLPIVVSRPAEERQAAGDNVPTAEPVAPAESGGIFGSKPAIVAPQESHECKHGQVWIDGKGCKNP